MNTHIIEVPAPYFENILLGIKGIDIQLARQPSFQPGDEIQINETGTSRSIKAVITMALPLDALGGEFTSQVALAIEMTRAPVKT